MGTILVIDGKPQDIDSLTPTELAKATRDILSDAQRRGLNSLTPEQCVGRYIDYLSLPEKRRACTTKTVDAATLARIEARIRYESRGMVPTARGGAPRETPKGNMGGKRSRGRASLHPRAMSQEEAETIDSQIKTLLEYTENPHAIHQIQEAGVTLPLSALSLTSDMPAWACVAKLNGEYKPAQDRWHTVKECLAFLSRSTYTKAYNYQTDTQSWGIHPLDWAIISNLTSIVNEAGKGPKEKRATPTPAPKTVTPAIGETPAVTDTFDTLLSGDSSAEVTIPAATVIPPSHSATGDRDRSTEPETRETEEKMPDTIHATVYAKELGPTTLSSFLIGAYLDDNQKAFLSGKAIGNPEDFAGIRTLLTDYYHHLNEADPMPATPKTPELGDYPSIVEWSDAISGMGAILVKAKDSMLAKQDRDKDRAHRLKSVLDEVNQIEARQSEAAARARREVEMKAKREAIAASRKDAASTLADIQGMMFPESDPDFVHDKGLTIVFKGLKRQLDEKGAAPNVLLTGAAGTGKTSIAMEFAAFAAMGFVSVECSLVRDASSLFGHWTASPSEGTRFVPTLLTRAIQAGNCVLLLDEINRFPDPSVSNGLLPLLDHRRGAWIDDIEQSIAFGPNIVVFATRNQGGKFSGTTATDAALESRFALFYETDTLSVSQTKTLILAKLPMLSADDAERIAKAGDAIRNAYGMGHVSTHVAQRQDLDAAEQFYYMGVEGLRYTYSTRFSADDLGGGAERTQVNGILQGLFPRY